VEDQQPATGDLTDAIPDHRSGNDASVEAPESEPSEAESTIDSAGGDDTEAGTNDDEELQSDDAAHDAETVLRQRRPAGKWSYIAAGVAAALFVGAAAFAGFTVQPYLTYRATVATKLRIARTAANAITTLWTYNPQNVDKLADRAAQYLSGDFEASYRKYIDAIAAPNKQAQITNTTEVTGAAVESLAGTDATALVYTNTTSTSPATKDIPSLKYLSYRLTMKRDHARWLVTKMTTITSLDLTPKF
jgi:Mce-associated membrane protein